MTKITEKKETKNNKIIKNIQIENSLPQKS